MQIVIVDFTPVPPELKDWISGQSEGAVVTIIFGRTIAFAWTMEFHYTAVGSEIVVVTP